jgi:hypothetical protein
MRENRTSGTVAGAPGNRSPYAGGNYDAYPRKAGYTSFSALRKLRIHPNLGVMVPNIKPVCCISVTINYGPFDCITDYRAGRIGNLYQRFVIGIRDRCEILNLDWRKISLA